MLRLVVFSCAICLAASAAAGDPAPPPTSSTGTVRMTMAQIAAYNASFEATAPEFIKCVRVEGPGSMVKRRVCRTNADWRQRSASAMQEARDIVDAIQLHGSTHGEEPPGSVVPAIPN